MTGDVILGLWDGHDAGVALVAGGALVFALAEERPARRKRCAGFPWRAIEAALDFVAARGLVISDVAVAGRRGRAPLRLLDRIYAAGDPDKDPLSLASHAVRGFENVVPGLPLLGALDERAGLAVLRARLRAACVTAPSIHLVDHHDAHAFSALLGDDGTPALVVTWDAYGEGTAFTARTADAPDAPLVRLGAEIALARLYGAVTACLGFAEGEEGKVMGLAAQGTPRGLDRLRALFDDAGGAPRLRGLLSRRRVEEAIAGLSIEDAAASLQRLTEEQAAAWIRAQLRRVGGRRRLLLAGGLFANVRLNQVLAELPEVDGLFVFPNMVDGGLPVGAAHFVHRSKTGRALAPIGDAYLGVSFDDAAIARAAGGTGLPSRIVADRAGAIAAHLIAGRVVCVHEGRDELGPRALGNRSILFRADEALVRRVNAALHRDDFMPFAPLLRIEDAAEAIEGPLPPADLRFMTITARATAALRARCPAAVHLDGTVRPQLVDAATNPTLHRALTLVREAGGGPAVINTSFNLHREPIVHTPEDAARTFLAAGLDVLLLGDREILR